jgi:hypothetical protein
MNSHAPYTSEVLATVLQLRKMAWLAQQHSREIGDWRRKRESFRFAELNAEIAELRKAIELAHATIKATRAG